MRIRFSRVRQISRSFYFKFYSFLPPPNLFYLQGRKKRLRLSQEGTWGVVVGKIVDNTWVNPEALLAQQVKNLPAKQEMLEIQV